MPNILDTHAIAGMVARYNDPRYQQWAAQIRATGGCAQPIHLRGKVEYRDGMTGELLHRYTTAREPGGVLRVACKTRRASRCPSCAEIYRADTFHLIRAGLLGGKGVPEDVADHPAVFVTLTAPSFGAVHARPERDGHAMPCRPRRGAGSCPHGRPQSCTKRHRSDDPRLGEPLCPQCYDYTGSVLFNALAPELWRRFTIRLRRVLARRVGLPVSALGDRVTVSFAKVAEYQRRGVVHFHAIIRLDGSDGPATPPPEWATLDLLTEVITTAARHVQVATPAAESLPPPLTLAWGQQIDIRPIATNGELSEQAVAGYVAKYATKAAECVGTLDRRIRPTDDLAKLNIRPHARRLISECLTLGGLPGLVGLRLAEWAHMLGFRGHFSTKSRRYSTTLAKLRAARAAHQRGPEITTGRLPFDDDTVLVTAHWAYVGQGLTAGESLLAAAINATHVPVTARPSGGITA